MEIKNKVALVTGASKGIGKAIAIKLAQEGASVIINYNTDQKGAEDTLTECNKYSQNNSIIQANVSVKEDVVKMVEEIKSNYNNVDILVNNAAIWQGSTNPNDTEVFENVFKANFLSVALVTEQILPLMNEGKIINISSIHGRIGHGNSHSTAYAAMKAALDNYTKNLAKALAPKILVNGIAPGKTLTPMWEEMSQEEMKELAETQLINRWITPEEIAHTVVFLVENDAMCGDVVTIDGGMGLKVLG